MSSTLEQRDLSELFPQPMAEMEEQRIALYLVEESPVKASAALRESMEKRGQLQPVILNAPGPSGGEYRIVDGRRRVAAARALGLTHIRAYMYDVNMIVESSLAVTANAVRGANPLSDLGAILHLAGAGYSEGDIARATGLAIGTIRKRRKLSRLHPDLLAGVKDGKIAVGVAERAAALPPVRQGDLAETFEEAGRITGEDVDAVGRVGREQAVAGIDAALFDMPDVPMQTPRERLRASLRDVLRAYGESIETADWMDACNAVWAEERT
jgi:ParB-like chromosome segregation protein Spo0J